MCVRINKEDQYLTFAVEGECVWVSRLETIHGERESGMQSPLNVTCSLRAKGKELSWVVSFYRTWSITELLPKVISQITCPQRPTRATKHCQAHS